MKADPGLDGGISGRDTIPPVVDGLTKADGNEEVPKIAGSTNILIFYHHQA